MASPFSGHEFEQTPGDGEGQGGLACCSPWGRKETDMTEQLNNYNIMIQAQEVSMQVLSSPSLYVSRAVVA